MAKAAARIDAFKPHVATSVFDEVAEEEEVVDELEDEESTEEDE